MWVITRYLIPKVVSMSSTSCHSSPVTPIYTATPRCVPCSIFYSLQSKALTRMSCEKF